MAEALRIVFRPAHLRRTIPIALCVGTVLMAINHGDTLLSGEATAGTAVKIAITFVVPFVVANLGLLAGKRAERR